MRISDSFLARIVMPALVVGLIAFASFVTLDRAPAEAGQDGFVPIGPYGAGVGSGGANVHNYNVTSLSTVTAVLDWNNHLGASRLSAASSALGCGSSRSCVLYGTPGTTRTVNGKSCTFPSTNGGSWATVYISGGVFGQNVGCSAGNSTRRIFFVSVDPSASNYPVSFQWRRHLVVHELGHALRLGDAATHTCWPPPGTSGTVFPLMNNVTLAPCGVVSTQPSRANFTPTSNEILSAKVFNGW